MQRNEIWNVWVPYVDEPAGGKERPAVIVGRSRMGHGEDQIVLVVPISDVATPKAGDIFLDDWQAFGLRKPSYVRARRVWGVSPRLIDRPAGSRGRITDEVMSNILLEMQKFF